MQPARDRLTEQEAYARAVEALEQCAPEEGLRILEPFVPTNPSNYRFWHLHGLLLRAADRRQEALRSLRRAVELAPDAVSAAHALARTLYEAGLPSVDAFGHALRLAPEDTEIVIGLAGAFVADGEPAAAISGLERILSRSPHWVEGHVLLSKLRWAQGERAGFARSFEEALRVLPQNTELRREHFIALMHAEHWDDVFKAVAEGRKAIGEHQIILWNEAAAYSEIGDVERADPLLARLRDIDDSSVQERLVRHFLRSGRPEEADRIVSEWLKRPEADLFWPYASITWRMLDDPRWEWLEGDDRLFGVYDIADRLPPLDQLAQRLRQLHTLVGQPLEQSLRGGTQTDGNLFNSIDPVLVQLREAIRGTVREHVAQLPPRNSTHPLLSAEREPIGFAGAWSVRLHGGGYHANHVHPYGWFSSALYIALPPDLGREQSGILTIGDPNSSTLKLDVEPFRVVEPKAGRLALFPSYSWHGTRPFGEGERLTVAFDVAVPGQRRR